MKSIAVIGLGFGDEGKGRVVDWLCATHRLRDDACVVRFSGGPQAAHRIVLPDGPEHIFSSYGSGTLRGIPTVLTKEVLVNPIALLNEFDVLLTKCETKPQLYINRQCPIITPYDIAWNRQSKERSNGTCGSGIFATVRRERAGCHFWFEDLYSGRRIIRMKLEQVARFYRKMKRPPDHDKMFLDTCDEMLEREAAYINHGRMYQLRIYEGSQGLLLDQNYGFFPHVTPSNTGFTNIPQSARDEVFLVTRAYQTRHGNGPMSPIIENKIKNEPNEKNFKNEYQGEFRKTLLDLDLLLYAMEKDPNIRVMSRRHLFMTCMDHVEEERRMFYDGNMFEAGDESNFWMKVHNVLGTKDVFTSRGPTARDVDHCI